MSSDLNKRYRRARTTALVLLIFLGITALVGAVGMILDPTGEAMELPPETLEHTPFDNFLIPAIILGVFNGILSLVFAVLIVRQSRLQSWFVLFQGGVLSVWLTAEVVMDLFYAPITLPYYLVAVLLILCGILMNIFRTVQS
ncbi:MAG: hypothetical protein KAR16_07445 [Bacteroidales bacterium]|nr:hypothetical protein [Bacteroidales bacterium]